MKRMFWLLSMTFVAGAALGSFGIRLLSAQESLKTGTVLQRTELKGASGLEAILVLRELPPGKESGRHTQSGNEIVYIESGSVTLEIQGKSPKTVNAGEAFTTSAGEVHNVKNTSATEPAKALAFYIAKKGARLDDLSVPAK
ncbi:MAG: cupin domain-containing protein [Acidobacteriales bacterium]|nr:cupin domain-containing protein [Terriglobales bacterium]